MFFARVFINKMKKLNVLLIEDDEIERLKFKRVCDKNNFNLSITEANNGEKALEYLNNDTSLPDFILLDLNMPKMNGIEFLKLLKSKEKIKYIPIIILSSSNNHNDVKECYDIGIAGYVIKPLHYEDYSDRISSLINYWKNNELQQV